MRQLLLLRHAKSDWSNNLADFDRPLAARGWNNAEKMGLWLQQQSLMPDYIVSSPAKRAQQTVEVVTEPIAIKLSEIHFDASIYEAGLSDLIKVLKQIPSDAQQVLLVGHNPGFDQLLAYLANDVETALTDEGKLMTTCALAQLNMPDDWGQLAPGCAELVSITRAKMLNF